MKKKIFEKLTAIFLVFSMIFAFALFVSADEPDIQSGTWGTLSWTLNQTTGKLVIFGEGNMGDFSHTQGEAWNMEQSSIVSVVIENGVTSIGAFAFANCSALEKITIPLSVTSIGMSAFDGCRSLTGIVIPSSVERIGESAFHACHSLEEVVLPDTITSIERTTFYECPALTNVIISSSVERIESLAFAWCTALTSVTIPSSVTSIGEMAFLSCRKLTCVTLPNSLTYIDVHAFNDCVSLETVIFCGTEEEWGNIPKHDEWDRNTGNYVVVFCPQHMWVEETDISSDPDEGIDEVTYSCPWCEQSIVVPIPSFGNMAEDDSNMGERHDHAWSMGEITTEATHMTEGVRTYTCVGCAQTKTEAIPRIEEHDFGEWTPVEGDENNHARSCVCGETETAAHAWNEGEITTEATHMTEGVKTYTCMDCGHTGTESLDKTEAHVYGSWQHHNAEQHKRSCECGDVQYAEHTLTEENAQICSDCACEIEQTEGCMAMATNSYWMLALVALTPLLLRKKQQEHQ